MQFSANHIPVFHLTISSYFQTLRYSCELWLRFVHGNEDYSVAFCVFLLLKMTEVQLQSREIPVLETVEDIERRREQVLRRYAEFKEATRLKRLRLEEAKRYHQWKRDVDECEIWITEKLQIASDESFKDATNLQVGTCEI